MEISKEDLLELLKDHLTIEVEYGHDAWYGKSLTVKILFNGEVVTTNTCAV